MFLTALWERGQIKLNLRIVILDLDLLRKPTEDDVHGIVSQYISACRLQTLEQSRIVQQSQTTEAAIMSISYVVTESSSRIRLCQ
jgi:hypothetical protein